MIGMSAVRRAARRLVHVNMALFHHDLTPPLCRPVRSCDLISTSLQNRKFSSKQKKGDKKEQKRSKVRANENKQEVEICRKMTVSALAAAMNRDCDHVYEALLNTPLNVDSLNPNSVLSEKWIKEVVKQSGMKCHWADLTVSEKKINNDAQRRPPAEPADLKPRHPVVTIMGHVDHGKTTLLDSLRKSQIVSTEAGGITQHIGAFLVQLPTGEKVTFLDTPGHAAFSAMRARGASVTDIIILVVAADDGVMTQTVESINHAKKAGVPIILAVNKCDKHQADPQRVKEELLAYDVTCEELGGDVQAIHISALKGENLLALTEATVTLAEMMELKAETSGLVEGVIIESRTDKGKGPVTTAVVQRGTLKRGSILVAGNSWAKVRNLYDENNRSIAEAGPSCAVEVVGWKDLPSAGELILEVESEQRAREVMEWRNSEEAAMKMAEDLNVIKDKQERHLQEYRKQREELSHLSWRKRKLEAYRSYKDKLSASANAEMQDEKPELPLIIKGDVDGSLEAILNILDGYDAQEECELKVVYCGIGDITENDVNMAVTFSGVIFGFNVAASKPVQRLAAKNEVPVRLNTIIYKLVDAVKAELNRKIPPLVSQNVVGEAAVLATFMVTEGKKKVAVAGCRVQKGLLDRGLTYKLVRGRDTVWEGSLIALKHHKDEVKTVKVGMECGLSVEENVDFQVGDIIVCYRNEESPQVTSWNPGF